MRERGHSAARLVVASMLVFALGCRQDMHDQPKYEPQEASAFFDDGRASRKPVEGTVARGQLFEDEAFFNGQTAGGQFVDQAPVTVDLALLERGRERYDIFCSPCHDRTGSGRGMIVQRGYKQPISFHTERIRSLPDGYLYNAIRSGFGVMPSYGAQVPPADRWAIVSYIRALQRSQHASLSDVPASERNRLGSGND